jgi:TonB family protein
MQSSTTPNANNNVSNTEENKNNATSTSNQNNSHLPNFMRGMNFGDGTGTGTAGSETGAGNPGTGGGGDGTGTGPGPGGVGGSLDGRGMLKKVNPKNQDNLEGRVVLKITVDENGNVTNISLISSNCNQCTQLAIDAVKQWKYEKKPGAGYQTGTVAVEFRL